MTNENIVNGFGAIGLYSYNESAIPTSAFVPSETFERPDIQPEPDHIDSVTERYNEDGFK